MKSAHLRSCLYAVFPGLLFSSLGAGADRDRVSYLGTGPSTVQFRVDFEDPERTSLDTGERAYSYLRWRETRSFNDEPGEPSLPARMVRVALPPAPESTREAVRLGIETSGLNRVRGIRFPPVPRWGGNPPEPMDADPRQSWTEGRGYSAGTRPFAEVVSVGIERGLRVALIAVRPVRFDPVTESAEWVSSVSVTVEFSTSPGPGVPPRRDPVAEASWARTLVNPDVVERFRATPSTNHPPAPVGGIPGTWFDDGAGWAKIYVDRNDIYALDRNLLSSIGVPVDQIDPRTFRIHAGPLVSEIPSGTLGWEPDSTNGWDHVYERPGFSGGFDDPGAMNQVAIRVTGEGDGSFDGSDRIVFYGLAPDNYRDRFGLPLDTNEDFFENPYSSHTVYWLTWGGTFTDQPLRMETVAADPTAGAAMTEATERVHAESNTLYSPTHRLDGVRWERWFWELMNNFASGYRFLVDLPHLVPGSTMDAHIRFWGQNQPVEIGSGVDELHHLQVDINQQDVGLFQWGGDTHTEALTPQDVFANAVPAADPVDFVFRVPSVPSGDPLRFDQIYLCWMDVTYRRALNLGGAPGELPVDAGTSGRSIRVTSPPTGNPDVYDVTDSRNPRRLTGATTFAVGPDTVTDFAFDRTAAGRVLLTDPASLPAPVTVRLDDSPSLTPLGSTHWLRDTTEPLDFVIISHDAFLTEANALAVWRRDNLHGITPGRTANVRVVRISDIMDEFAAGMWDPMAIRYFLEYAFLYYTGDPVAYCLFLGDHTYDQRGFGAGSPTGHLSWDDNHGDIERFGDSGNVQFTSDDFLAWFDGLNDGRADLFLGRITARSPAQAGEVIVNKILAGEMNPIRGPWRARALFAADDLCQLGVTDPIGVEFTRTAENIQDMYLPSAFDRDQLYLIDYGFTCNILGKPQAKIDFIEAWNEGAWLVDYVGHGDESFYADEQLLHFTDLSDLQNGRRLPLFIATASKSGKFNQPSTQGIAESVLNMSGGGAMAVTGSVSNQTPAFATFGLNELFIEFLFPTDEAHNPIPMGAAFTESKGFIGGSVTNRKYMFFGDPAALPPVPELELTLTGPDTLWRGQLATADAVIGGSPGNGTAIVEFMAEGPRETVTVPSTPQVTYRQQKDRLFRGNSLATSDSASTGFVVPISASVGGGARIRGYASWDDFDAIGSKEGIEIAGTPDPQTDTTPPVIAFNGPTTLAIGELFPVDLNDASGIRLSEGTPPDIELTITDAVQTEVLRIDLTDLFLYDAGSYTQGTATFPIPDIPPGNYTFAVTARDNYGNQGSGSAQVEITTSVSGARFSGVFAYPNPMKTSTQVVFSMDRSTEIQIRIFSVSGRMVLHEEMFGALGRNLFQWDGTDRAGDPVANGVYLLQLSAPGESEASKHLERLVVVR